MAGVDPSEARAALAERLGPASLAHCERVAETAARLAGRFGLDEADARLAGLLHDWEREAEDEDLLAKARSYGILVSEVDEAVPYLLHADVAAREVAEVFPALGEDVVEAVGTHTVGSPTMGPLAKLVYVADMIEPARGFEGVEPLRRQAERAVRSGLDELFGRAYRHTLLHLVTAGRPIHPRSVETWNRLVADGGR